ncbi:MAG: hypoxanthine phosphoribosyltransferase [Alphaproteobacteria bacterium]|nr:MAG: hypoxanthine phosphoribosyltransferase [Alphaproteobacteria bacterium]
MTSEPDVTPDRIATLFSAEDIAARIEHLADAVVAAARRPLLVEVIMNGAVIFGADLVRALSRRGQVVEMDFIALSSYGKGTESSGDVVLEADARGAIAGRDVLLIDDILETGRTLAYARDYFASRGAAQVLTCVLLDKSAGRDPVIRPDFAGFPCPDLFVIGYGMDYAYRFRELPYIGYIKSDEAAHGADPAR